MRNLIQFYRTCNILSIDVVIGSVCCCYFFGDFFGTLPSLISIIVLSLSVWIIYTIDHLSDAYMILHEAKTARHAFHQKHFRIVFCAVLAVTLVNVILIFFLPIQMILMGGILSSLVLGYFIISKLFSQAKEVLAAFLYSFGVLIPVMHGYEFSLIGWLLISQFYSVALMNLFLFSLFDYKKDLVHGTYSFVTVNGTNATVIILWAIFLFNSACVVIASFHLHFLLFWFITLGHAILFLTKNVVNSRERFRLIGDALFVLPAISLVAG